MDDLTAERRQAFALWLRTGRLPVLQAADNVELKFNPWHDWATGRFTFAGTGRHAGGWMGGGFAGGGGGHFGGGGATGTWTQSDKGPKVRASLPSGSQPSRRAGSLGSPGAKAPEATRTPRAIRMSHQAAAPFVPKIRFGTTPSSVLRQPVTQPQIRRLVRNSYEYRIDEKQRTVDVSGTLTLSVSPVRSRATQARAGGVDRRRTDDGGHYIAARFNGPTDAFNHFAQDKNFNRGDYKALENQWAEATKSGKQVSVKITPYYEGTSSRPVTIVVRYLVNGVAGTRVFPNERQEKPRGK